MTRLVSDVSRKLRGTCERTRTNPSLPFQEYRMKTFKLNLDDLTVVSFEAVARQIVGTTQGAAISRLCTDYYTGCTLVDC